MRSNCKTNMFFTEVSPFSYCLSSRILFNVILLIWMDNITSPISPKFTYFLNFLGFPSLIWDIFSIEVNDGCRIFQASSTYSDSRFSDFIWANWLQQFKSSKLSRKSMPSKSILFFIRWIWRFEISYLSNFPKRLSWEREIHLFQSLDFFFYFGRFNHMGDWKSFSKLYIRSISYLWIWSSYSYLLTSRNEMNR